MKQYLTPALAFLAALFLILWLTKGCDRPTTPPDATELWEQLAQKDVIIKSYVDTIAQIRKERQIDEVKFAKTEGALKGQIKAKDKSLAQAREDIAEFRATIPQVDSFVLEADSAIAVRDSLINALGMRMRAAEYSYKEEIRILGEKNVVQVQKFDELMTTVVKLENDNDKLARKLERKKRGNRLLLGIGAGLAAAIGILTISQ